MPTQPKRSGFNISFFGTVAAIMAALKLKEQYDKYMQSRSGEGRVALNTDEEEAVSLLDTQLPTHRAPGTKRGKNCCVCCGMNCGLFCKALGIAAALFFIWYAIKFVIWAATPSPTGLENMPVYNTSLGCLDAQYFYNDEQETVIDVPMGQSDKGHAFDITSGAVGTFVIAEGDDDLTKVQYKITVRSDDKSSLDQVTFTYPTAEDAENSRLRISTGSPSKSCMRFDIKIFVPPSLRKLHIKSHSPMHVKFDEDNRSHGLDEFFVTLFSSDEKNMILPHQHLVSDQMFLEVYRGWIVGDVAIASSTSITTQRGDGVANVRIHPVAPEDVTSPETATLQTTTGSGRTDVFYINSDSSAHRPISSTHISSGNGDMYLTFKEAEFSGLIGLKSKSYSATGLQPLSNDSTWTHWHGDKEGKDRITVNSRGWTGLYF